MWKFLETHENVQITDKTRKAVIKLIFKVLKQGV